MEVGRRATVLSGLPSRPKEGRRGGISWSSSRVGLEREKRKFFQEKSFPIFRVLKIDQIQMKFEFNPKQPNPTLNQK